MIDANPGPLAGGIWPMTTCRNGLNLTRWLVLSAAGIGKHVNLKGKRTCRQIEAQRRP
jgi:hypothetical protein